MIDEYILDAEELPEFELQDASKSKRFLNWILDTIFYYILLIAVYFLVGFTLVSATGSLTNTNLTIKIVFFAWYIGYFTLSEWILKGRTLAKFATKTKVVTELGYPITLRHALIRSLCRLIPIEPFAYLFTERPWHDSLTDTRVVDWPNK